VGRDGRVAKRSLVGSVVGRLLLLVSGLAIALALAEGAAAVLAGRRCGGGRPPLWRPDRRSGWALVPGAQGDVSVCESGRPSATHHVAINALGHRDRPRDYARAPGVRRLLVLGDSFVEALQVDLDETFTARLEQRLGIEVLNAGVSGYSTDNELRAFLADGRRYRPDAVLLLFFVGNDVLDNGARLYLRNPHGLPAKPWLRARAAGPRLARCLAAHRAAARLADGMPTMLWNGSRLVRAGLTVAPDELLRAACVGATGPRSGDSAWELLEVYRPPDTPGWKEAWSITESLLLRLDRRVRASGARFGVAVVGAGFEYDPRMRWYARGRGAAAPAPTFSYPYERLGVLLSRAHIPWVSLTPALRELHARTGRSGCYPIDGHWTPEGHQTVADALAEFATGLVAPARASPAALTP